MAKTINKQILKSFGKRKKGVSKKKPNKHECTKSYNRQGR